MRYTVSDLNKGTVNKLKEFFDRADEIGGNCVSVSDWVSGKGRYTKLRALPCYVYRIERDELNDPIVKAKVSTVALDECRNYFSKYPLRKAVLVFDREMMLEDYLAVKNIKF